MSALLTIAQIVAVVAAGVLVAIVLFGAAFGVLWLALFARFPGGGE